jgi:hypothetical protein
MKNMNDYEDPLAPRYFERRELKPYAQPVSPKKLKKGVAYFIVLFTDDEMLVPIIETFVFIGKNLRRNDAGWFYFQDVDSYREGIRYSPRKRKRNAKFAIYPKNNLNHVFEYERALDVLMRCALRRQEAGL